MTRSPLLPLFRWAAITWFIFLFTAMTVRAQCGGVWLEGEAAPETNGPVFTSTMWDPDGPGPMTSKLVVGGSFTTAGNIDAIRVAVYDLSTRTWSALGPGLPYIVDRLVCLPNGDLIANGVTQIYQDNQSPIYRSNIDRWSTSANAWISIGADIPPDRLGYPVKALEVLPNGDLIVGGQFSLAGGNPAANIVRWNGTAWSPLPGSGVLAIYSLLGGPDGNLIASGKFEFPGMPTGFYIARWDGTTWSAIGSEMSGAAHRIASLPDGGFVIGNSSGVLHWDGTTWSQFGLRPGSQIKSMIALPNGDILVGGSVHLINGNQNIYAARRAWTTGVWEPLDSITWTYQGSVLSFTLLPDNNVFIGGGRLTVGDRDYRYVAQYDGYRLGPLGSAMNYPALCMARMRGVELVVGGSFTHAGGNKSRGLSRWNGSTWSPVDSGIYTGETLNYIVRSLSTLPNGELIVGGYLHSSAPMRHLARWDGIQWSPVSTTELNSLVWTLRPTPNGDVVIGGFFTGILNGSSGGVAANHIARWDGTSLHAIGSGFNDNVHAAIVRSNGDLVVGGSFTRSGTVPMNGIARWNGTTWEAFGSGINGTVNALLTMPNGDLVASGTFTSAGGTPADSIARWSDATGTWTPMNTVVSGSAPSSVFAMTLLPDGDLIIARYFRSTQTYVDPWVRIQRWKNATSKWSNIGLMSSYDPSDMIVSCLTLLPNGELAAGGSFTNTRGSNAAYFARYSFTGVPTMSVQPRSQTVPRGATLVLSATPSNGYSGVAVQWERDNVPITLGTGGASFGGGTVNGAAGVLASPTRVSEAVLTISDVSPSDAGSYVALFFNTCGVVRSQPAVVTVGEFAPCSPADVGSQSGTPGPDGFLDNNDINVFIDLFMTSRNTADLASPGGQPGSDGRFDNNDFIVFIGLFFAGC